MIKIMVNFIIIPKSEDPFLQNLDYYSDLVEEIEDGYHWSIFEYPNDLQRRNVIQKMLDNGFVPDAVSGERLRQLDERFQALLIPTGSFFGSYPPQYFWYYGVPNNAEEILKFLAMEGEIQPQLPCNDAQE